MWWTWSLGFRVWTSFLELVHSLGDTTLVMSKHQDVCSHRPGGQETRTQVSAEPVLPCRRESLCQADPWGSLACGPTAPSEPPSSAHGPLPGLRVPSSLLIGCCCSVTKTCPTLCAPMDCSTAGSSVPQYLPEFAQTHVHRVGDAIQPSHPLLLPSPPAFTPSQHQGLFQ